MNRLYFPNVNFLRAFAAVLVLVYHVIELSNWSSFPAKGAFLTFRLGWLGVDLFFVISGFVIGLSGIKLYREGGSNFRVPFFRRRLARIVPLYLFTAAIFLFFVSPELLQMKFKTLMSHVLAHAAFIHSWFYKTHGSINGPNWSVAVEMQFYLLAILLIPVLSKVKPWKILFWGIVIAWMSRFAGFWWMMDRQDAYRTFIFTTQAPSMADEFAFGIFLARIVLDGKLEEWAQRWKHSRLILIAGTVLLTVVCLKISMNIFWQNSRYWDNVFMVTFWRTAIALSFTFVVACFCLLPDLTKNWACKPFHYLGEISYGIYLWHLPVILSLKRVLPPDNYVLFLNWSIVLTLILASLSWHLFEKPLVQRYR